MTAIEGHQQSLGWSRSPNIRKCTTDMEFRYYTSLIKLTAGDNCHGWLLANARMVTQIGPAWPRLTSFGPGCPCLDQVDNVWSHLALFGPVWPCLAVFGTIWPRLTPLSFAWPLFNFDLKVRYFTVPIRRGYKIISEL